MEPFRWEKSFGQLYPDLVSEWSVTLNTKSPYEVPPDSSHRAIWLCPINRCLHHVYRLEVRMRVAFHLSPTRETACSYCSGVLTCECNSFATLRPDLLPEWNYERNDGKDPKELSTFSAQRFWWKCSKSKCNCHNWQASIASRVKGRGNCPYCASRKVCPCNAFAINYPELLDQWDYERNGNLNPSKVHPRSSVIVAWICRARGCDHHRFSTPINRRFRHGKVTGCPYCKHSGKGKCCECDSLGKNHPELLEDWYWEKNSATDPFAIPPLSQKIVSWKCKLNHEWLCTIERMTKGQGGCPSCLIGREPEREMIEDFLLSDDEVK
jgi:uncharacterized Zn-finger protein